MTALLQTALRRHLQRLLNELYRGIPSWLHRFTFFHHWYP